jgi:hypothetical protein
MTKKSKSDGLLSFDKLSDTVITGSCVKNSPTLQLLVFKTIPAFNQKIKDRLSKQVVLRQMIKDAYLMLALANRL